MAMEIRDVDGRVLYRALRESADLRDTVRRAVDDGVDLARADLKGAALGGMDLELRSADLSAADLTGANLEKCDGDGACLDDAKLDGANLEHLRGKVKARVEGAAGPYR